MKLKKRYKLNKSLSVGEELVCPSCGSGFVKSNYQQAFCKTKGGTKCKDKYWNTVTPSKRNNKTRISPASASFLAKNYYGDRKVRKTTEGYKIHRNTAIDEWGNPVYDIDRGNDEHSFSGGGLGQWE